MAVVSLSRIQIRRGRKTQDGLPQLASGEFAWAIDTQELYIGNGSLSEGSPQVGNTKILTEHDNIFDLTESYYYGRITDVNTNENGNLVRTYNDIPNVVGRTLQARLDDYVSLRAFGGTGDGSDHSEILQNAVNQLFRQDTQSRTPAVTLYVEPGTYVLSKTINLPPGTRIQGSGAGRTVFQIIDNLDEPFYQIFKPVAEEYEGENNNIIFAYPSNITISDITVNLSEASATPKSIFYLEGCTHCHFSKLELIGDFFNRIHRAFYIKNVVFGDDAVVSKHNTIENVFFNYFENAIYSPSDIYHNTIQDCVFENSIIAVLFDFSQSFDVAGSIANTIENCWFDKIEQNAIKIVKGSGNVSKNNKYNDVGNVSTIDAIRVPEYPVIEFLSASNSSEGDWFLRTEDLKNTETLAYVPEVKGVTIYENKFRNRITIGEYDQPVKVINVSVYDFQTVEVQYKYKSNQYDACRSGTLTLNADTRTGQVSIDDQFTYVGDPLYLDNMSFSTQNYNNSGSVQYAIDTVGILMLNSTNNDTADFYYSIKYIN